MANSRRKHKELEWTGRHGQPAYVRIKALAVLNLLEGKSPTEVARMFRVSRAALYLWRTRYEESGVEGFRVRSGRGRKAQARPDEIERYLRQSPRAFGLRRTRWTLQALAEVVPSLKGFSPYGVQKALERAGYRYKRGQPWIHSPDPEYDQKKGLWTKR